MFNIELAGHLFVVDEKNGDDKNDGLTQDTAIKTMAEAYRRIDERLPKSTEVEVRIGQA